MTFVYIFKLRSLQWNEMGHNSAVSECDTFFGFTFCFVSIRFSLSHLLFLSYMVDPPTIRLLGAPQIDLEEGKDSLVLRCEADANPPASIVWKRAQRSEIASLQVSTMLMCLFWFFLLPFVHSFGSMGIYRCHELELMYFGHNGKQSKIQFDREQLVSKLKRSQIFNFTNIHCSGRPILNGWLCAIVCVCAVLLTKHARCMLLISTF